jgi:hypothetical protein
MKDAGLWAEMRSVLRANMLLRTPRCPLACWFRMLDALLPTQHAVAKG